MVSEVQKALEKQNFPKERQPKIAVIGIKGARVLSKAFTQAQIVAVSSDPIIPAYRKSHSLGDNVILVGGERIEEMLSDSYDVVLIASGQARKPCLITRP